VRDQVSHPYKTTGKTTVLYTLIFVFLDSNLEDNRWRLGCLLKVMQRFCTQTSGPSNCNAMQFETVVTK
jgi:hypothetical protein